MIWQTTNIEEISEVKGGKRLPSGHDFSPDPTNHLYIRARDIGAGKIQCDQPVYISDETYQKIARYTVDEGDIVITIVGANVGDVGYVSDELVGANLTENAAKLVVDRKRYDPVFLKYFLASRSSKERLAFIASGAAQGKLGLYKIKSFSVPEPPLPVQRNVSSVLSAYDDLIENNRRRIALLEEAARLLYREWFVHFRYPGHEHVKIIDGVPEGWAKSCIGDLSSFLARGITPKYDDEAPGLVINQKCIRSSKVNLEPARRQSKRVPEAKLVRPYDVLINSTGTGTLGRVAQNFHDLPNLTVDSHVTIARPREEVLPIWYGLTLTLKQDFIATLGRGATNQTELSKDDVVDIELLVPTDDILQDFEGQASFIIRQINVLSAQSNELSKARDLLLPRLMDGRLEV